MSKILISIFLYLISWSLADSLEINENEFHLLKTEDKYFTAHNNRTFLFSISFLQKNLETEWKNKIFGTMEIYSVDSNQNKKKLMAIQTNVWGGDPNNFDQSLLYANWDKPGFTKLKKGNYYLITKIYIPKAMPSNTPYSINIVERSVKG